MVKIISWNVNGFRAILKKGFTDWFKKEQFDFLMLQETKTQEIDLPLSLSEKSSKYQLYYNSAKKKGYAGTAIFSKHKPENVTYGINQKNHDNEGRVVTLEFAKFFLVDVYVPNSGRGLPRLDYRKEWDLAFLKYLKKLEKKKPVIIGGDFNVAHEEIDLARPKQNYNKTAGFTQTEIDGFDNFVKAGFVDTFRYLHPKKVEYSYWSYRFNAKANNVGWRVDYFLVSDKIKNKVKAAEILTDVKGSDHCPVSVELDF
ncbi:MAG: exodeoxyribonuclease III [archaeon]|nr:exodeoxyribonuclease III [Nanoarchaeota archaeon]